MTFVGVCGGRYYRDAAAVAAQLRPLVASIPDLVIVHGGARGADSLAGDAAAVAGVHVVVVPALWGAHGKSAGARRNAVIAAMPLTRLIAFPGGPGTADMVRRAREKGIAVVEVPA